MGQFLKNNKYSNYPEMKEVLLKDIKITGIFLGKNRSAIIKIGSNQETYIIKEGMIIGRNGGIVKAILPGGMVVVEKIKNVYDQEEFIETIIPVF